MATRLVGLRELGGLATARQGDAPPPDVSKLRSANELTPVRQEMFPNWPPSRSLGPRQDQAGFLRCATMLAVVGSVLTLLACTRYSGMTDPVLASPNDRRTDIPVAVQPPADDGGDGGAGGLGDSEGRRR